LRPIVSEVTVPGHLGLWWHRHHSRSAWQKWPVHLKVAGKKRELEEGAGVPISPPRAQSHDLTFFHYSLPLTGSSTS
jgi:hypothetical protein